MDEDKLVLMVHGHEIWLESMRSGEDRVELSVLYGHNMRIDGMAKQERMNARVYSPEGAVIGPLLAPMADHYDLTFKPEKAGYYTAFADLSSLVISHTSEGHKIGPKHQFKDVTYAGAFHQMAKKVVGVGDAGEFKNSSPQGILEIMPQKINPSVGEDLALEVYYEGKALPSVEIKAVSKEEGKEMAKVVTDGQGVAKIPISRKGTWMFLARHNDPTKKVADLFDESVFVTTLVMEAV